MILRTTTSAHPLEAQVKEVARRARWLVWLYAISWFVGCLVIAFLLCGLVDTWFRLEEIGLRVLLSLAIVGGAIAAYWRWISPAVRYRLGPIETCQHIERWAPDLSGRLSSAVAFLEVPASDLASSPAMRSASIATMERLSQGRNFLDCLDARPTWRAVAFGGSTLLLGVAMFVAAPSASLLVTGRLLWPWSRTEWPRRNQLQFTSFPHALAAGQDFYVEIVDQNGRPPDQVILTYRFGDESGGEERTRTLLRVDDRFSDRLENVARSFSLRAQGGDDETDWASVSVREPIRVSEFSLEVQPPEYSGWKTQAVDASFRALVGSTVLVTGRADRTLKQATLHFDREGELPRQMELGTDRRTFLLRATSPEPWIVEAPCSYWLELVDEEGVVGGQEVRGQLQVVADDPPDIHWRMPPAISSTGPAGLIPIQFDVEDELAIAEVELLWRRGDDPPNEFHKTFLFPSSDSNAVSVLDRTGSGSRGGQLLQFSGKWPLAEVGTAEPGTILELSVVARDRKPQETQSEPRRITVVSTEEIARQMRLRQSQLLTRLLEALDAQRAAHSHIAEIRVQFQESRRADRKASAQLQAAELDQRRVSQRLFETQEGVLALAERLLSEPGSETAGGAERERLANFRNDLHDLQEHAATAAERGTRDASRQLRAALRDRTDTEPELAEGAALRALESVLARTHTDQEFVRDRLEEWAIRFRGLDQVQNLTQDLHRVADQQEELHEETTRRLSSEALAKPMDELNAEQRAEVKRLAERQRLLARDLDQLLRQIEAAQEAISAEDSEAGSLLAETRDALQQAAASELMREGSRQLEQNRLGGAAELQQQVLEALTQARQQLSHQETPNEENSTPANQRQEMLTAAVLGLAQQQATLANRWKTLEKAAEESATRTVAEPDRRALAEDQSKLSKQTLELARSDLAQSVFKLALGDAAEPMSRAAQLIQSQPSGEGVTPAQTEASERLQRVVESLQVDKEPSPPEATGDPAETSPRTPSGGASVAELRMVRALQIALNQRTAAFATERTDSQEPSDADRQQFADLIEEQARLAQVIAGLIPQRPANAPEETSPSKSSPSPASDIPGLDDQLLRDVVPGAASRPSPVKGNE